MGFLGLGQPMTWEDTESYHAVLTYVREHGITQFLRVFHRVKDRTNDVLLWGDEVEYHIAVVSKDTGGEAKLALRAAELLAKLNDDEDKMGGESAASWHPEYGSWMVEGTPARPYGGFSSDLRKVETNMRLRRMRISASLRPGEMALSIPAFPLMGVGDFCFPSAPPGGPFSNSLFLPDACINPHPRFGTLTRNIRRRRGKKIDIRMPLFHDKCTDEGDAGAARYGVSSADNHGIQEAGEIYMDAMGFGMGCCCLQITFQARDISESRYLYDQLAVLCPIFLALSAGTPILKGLLADTDVRWDVIAQSVDCRTPVELGASETATAEAGCHRGDGEAAAMAAAGKPRAPQRGKFPVRKSRYESVDRFISTSPNMKPEYNDNPSEVDQETLARLMDNGVDEALARHLAYLWIRDPLVIFSERIEVDDDATTEHFENIQSTNWHSMRWKPPPPSSDMGWRVEFRPMDIQLTDFENAALTVLTVLISRVVLFFDLNLYIPISKVDENMRRAHKRDAVLEQKFFFRKNLVPLEAQCGPITTSEEDHGADGSETMSAAQADTMKAEAEAVEGDIADAYEEMTIRQILMGQWCKGESFPGLVPLIWAYLDIIECDEQTRTVVGEYIDLIEERAKGDLPTLARWTRDFVSNHREYSQDSVVTPTIATDLLQVYVDIAEGKHQEPSLMGEHVVLPLSETSDRDAFRSMHGGMKLRGSSFKNEVGMSSAHAYQCAIVRALVDNYKKSNVASKHVVGAQKGFAGTEPFFGTGKLVRGASGNP